MTKKEEFTLSYILSKSLFFSFILPFIYKLSIHSFIITIILGYLFGYIILKIITKHNINKIIICILSIIFIVLSLYLVVNEVYNFYLPNTPIILVILLFLITIIYGSTKNKKGLFKLSELLFYINILLLFSGIILNLSNFNYMNILPINIYINKNIILSILLCTLSSILPILLFCYLKQDYNHKILFKSYLLSFISILLLSISTISTLGIKLSTTFNYPEYIAFKKIQILNFVSRIENIIVLFSIIDLVILGITSILCIKKIFSKN